jgi:hypothetical protein
VGRPLLERLVPVARAQDGGSSPEESVTAAVWNLGATLVDSLVRAGWTIRANVGEPIGLEGPSGALETRSARFTPSCRSSSPQPSGSVNATSSASSASRLATGRLIS